MHDSLLWGKSLKASVTAAAAKAYDVMSSSPEDVWSLIL